MKLPFLILFLSCYLVLPAQTVVIDDQDLLNAIIGLGIDTNNDGLIQTDEADSISSLDFNNVDFRKIDGLEGFVNLTNLSISNNASLDSIEVLDLIVLDTLSLENNNAIESIIVNNHPSLTYFNLLSGEQQKELLIENILTLKEINIEGDKLAEIELSNLQSLENFTTNRMDSLKLLVLSDLPNLEEMKVSSFANDFEMEVENLQSLLQVIYSVRNPVNSLDISLFPNLEKLILSDPYTSINTIEIRGHEKLEELKIINYTLDSIKLQSLPSLKLIDIELPSELKKIEFDSLLELENVYIDTNIGLIEASISNSLKLEALNFNSAINLELLNLYNLPMLKELSVVSETLKSLDVSALNNLEDLRLTSNSLEYLYCKNNSNENLICFDCSSLLYICADENDVFGTLDPMTFIGSFCPHTSSGFSKEVTGSVIYDLEDNNCDSLGIIMPFISFEVNRLGELQGTISSNSEGVYGLYYDNDSLAIRPSRNDFNNLFNFLPDSLSLLTNDSIIILNQDICVTAKQDIANLELVLNDPLETRPGNEAKYKLLIRNKGSLVPVGKISLYFEDDFLTVDEIIPEAELVAPNQLEWSVPPLLPFEEIEFEISFILNTPMDDFPLNSGDTLVYEVLADINTDSGDRTFSYSLYDEVVNSYDPNDKQCMQGESVYLSNLDDYLYYKIRFENLGTAEAQNIVVQDTLDIESFNLETFEVVQASHRLNASVDNNIATFIFEDINLGFEDDVNKGFLVFKIKPNDDLALGHELVNEASIYFDYNFPIHTNISLVKLVEELVLNNDDISQKELDFYPNISQDFLHINDKSINGRVRILNSQGIEQGVISISSLNTIDVSRLSPGAYFLLLEHNNTIYTGKFIKV